MNKPERMGLADIGLFALLFLVFFQLLTAFIETTYAFGLLQTGIPYEVVSILFLFLPVVLLFFRRPVSGSVLTYLGLTILVSRALSILLDTRGQMLVSGLGTGLFLVFLPLALIRMRSQSGYRAARTLGAGLALSVLFAMLLRALYSGNDLSTVGSYRAIAWGIAALGYLLLPGWVNRTEPDVKQGNLPVTTGFWRLAGLCIGLVSALTLLYFAFTSPTVIARWSGQDYVLIAALAVAALVLFLALQAVPQVSGWLFSRSVVLIWNVLFIAALTLVLWLHGTAFPTNPGAYPLPEATPSPLAGAALISVLLLYPVILVNFSVLSGEAAAAGPSVRLLGGAFLLAAFYLLLIIFAQVFTTVYDYIPVIGPWFRDRFWLVFLAAGAGMALPVLLVGRERFREAVSSLPGSTPGLLIPALVLGAGTILALLFVTARPSPPADQSSLRILTYNIQQGYSDDGQKNLEGQLKLMRDLNPDLIGLQESDMARIAGGNSDEVRLIADRLNMYSYYGPKTVTGTFGIALLSRYPIRDARTFFMYSEGEQTAAIEALVDVSGRTFVVLVTHLGNGGPLIQQQQVLEWLEGKENIIAMGDFNFRPDSEQYAQTTAVLDDAWLAAGTQRMNPEGQNIERRIDHIFVSPGISVTAAEYIGRGPSDHPAMFAEIAW